MRLFISINPDEETADNIYKVQQEFKKRISDINKDFVNKIKWEEKNKFHMTLFFIGEADDKKAVEIDSVLREISAKQVSGEIQFSFGILNAFPKMRYPRVLFLELNNTDKKIFELSKRINECLIKTGIKSDKQFHPHITLGRVKRNKKINLLEFKNEININHKFTAKDLYLMESELKVNGSEYKVLKKYNLKERNPA